MIGSGIGVRIYRACGVTDMKKGIEGVSAVAQDHHCRRSKLAASRPAHCQAQMFDANDRDPAVLAL